MSLTLFATFPQDPTPPQDPLGAITRATGLLEEGETVLVEYPRYRGYPNEIYLFRDSDGNLGFSHNPGFNLFHPSEWHKHMSQVIDVATVAKDIN